MRRYWRQLRWRIVGAQMLVVVVGVVTLILVASIVTARQAVPEVQQALQSVLVQSLGAAALLATVAGLATSLLLTRQILQPLQQLSHSSRRIAEGRYDERVADPDSDELAEVAASFNQMAEALAQIEQQRVSLLGNVAHELRTPLTGLAGYLEGLQDGMLPNDPETIDAMQHELRRLRRLVDDLQALSRVEAGQVALQLESVDLLALVRRIVAQLQPQSPQQHFHIEVDSATPPLAYADPDRSAQILVNLIGNAIRYTAPDGQITVRLALDDWHAIVTVQDTGIGISAEDLAHIFERFYRVDSSRARSSGGSGIGLTIARHLAWAMGGELTAASAGPGQGSSFTLTLPRA